MPYGTLALDAISTSGNLAIAGNVAATRLETATIRSTSTTPPTIQNSAGTEIGTFCRAWVNFNGTGTVAIRAAFNVSSITDNGVGNYTINFTDPMPSDNYSYVTSLTRDTATGAAVALQWQTDQAYSTTSFGVKATYTTTASQGLLDSPKACVAVFV